MAMNWKHGVALLAAFFLTGATYGVAHLSSPTPPELLPTVPGALNPAVTQDNINSTICVSGWTATIRPPVSYTNSLKEKQLTTVDGKKPNAATMAQFEEDHLISLQLGGNPTDPNNLWPESYSIPLNGKIVGARTKDQVEDDLKRQVCAGKMTLKQAQTIIRTDWYAYYLSMKPSFGGVDSVVDEDDQ